MATLTFVCAAFALLSLVNGVMAAPVELSKEEIQIKFNEADKDGNAKLSAKEFKEVILTLAGEPVDEDDLNYMAPALMSVVDEDGDGMITYNELTKAILSEPNEEQMMRRMFIMTDADLNGKMTEAEFMEFDRIVSGGDGIDADGANYLITIADQDGDGMMSFEEYYSQWTKKKPMQLK